MIAMAKIVEHLKGDVAWSDVKEISDLSTLDIARSGTRSITWFVFQQGERPSPEVRGSGPLLQSITQTVGVVIVAKVVNDDKFDFAPVRKALRKKLFGWTPDDDHAPFSLGAGQLLNVRTGQVAWLDSFITEYTEDQNRYGKKI